MARIYLRLQVDFDDDPDVSKLARYRRPGEARAVRDLLVSMWRYCKRELSDGHVPREMVGKLAYPDAEKVALRDAERLVECGIAERTDSGYYLPGYLKHNKSRAQIEEERIAKVKAGSAGGRAKQAAKQAASTLLSKNDEPAKAWSSQSSEFRVQSSETGTTKEGGDVSETSPNDGRAEYADHCLDHRYVQNPPPCGGCKEQRERNRKQDQRARLTVVGDCARCGGSGWIEHEDGRPARKCNHGRTA